LSKKPKAAQCRADDWRTVVGVVGDTRDSGPDAVPSTVMFVPFAQEVYTGAMIIRTGAEPTALASSAAQAIRSLDPQAVVERVQTLEQVRDDRVASRKVNALLVTSFGGLARGVWSVVHVPSVAEEDRRHLHRELFTLTRQRPRQVNRSKGLRALHGIVLAKPRGLPARQPELCDWNGAPLPPAAAARVAREWTRLRAIQRDVVALRTTRRQLLDAPDAARDPLLRQVEQLCALRGIGEVSAWLYATEFFGWRAFRNRRQVAGLAGLTPPTRSSGDLEREPGISKAGNARIRGLAVELAWSWVRRQPTSALARWYRARCAAGGGRQRRIGIVAVARKLLIALWRYLETGVVPEGAVLKA
jgi:transposase